MPGDKKDNISIDRDELRELLAEAVSMTPPSAHTSMSKDQCEEIVANGVKSAFTQIGVDVSDPLAMQRDFQFVRSVRKASNHIKSTARATAIGVVVTAVLGLIWVGIKAAFTGH
jgi:hypothetical protein